MGKKQKAVLDKMKDKFIKGAGERGHAKEICEKVWTDWEAFAQYAFNKSHSTCYSLVAYHTAYLKANYPAEYMAAVLTHSQNNLENVTFFIEECRSLGIKVLGPHVNESGIFFEVNKAGEIRFGLGAIKGAGEAAVDAIIQEREARGHFEDIFDLTKRMAQRSVNKKTLECLALSGALDCFESVHRRQYVFAKDGDISLLEKALKFALKTQQDEQSAQASLFGGGTGTAMPKPRVEYVEPYSEIEKLNLEKEVVGIYISGHPLDNFKFEMDHFCTITCNKLSELDPLLGRELKLGGIVSGVEHRTTKTGKPFGKFTLEDYTGNYSFVLFSEDYLKFKNFMSLGWFLFIEGAVVKNNWGQQNVEFKIRNIDLLNEIGVKRSKGVKIRMNTRELTRDMIGKIETVCQEFSGNTPLYLKLTDDGERINLELMSRKFRVNPINDMVKKMKKAGELDVEVVF
jgi:DNA polymerase-3 subunit alpha